MPARKELTTMRPLDDESRGWVAGMLEGEGSFKKAAGYARVTLAQVDRSMVERLRDLTGVGTISAPHHREGRQPVSYWTVAAGADVEALIVSVFHLLSERRQDQALKALA